MGASKIPMTPKIFAPPINTRKSKKGCALFFPLITNDLRMLSTVETTKTPYTMKMRPAFTSPVSTKYMLAEV